MKIAVASHQVDTSYMASLIGPSDEPTPGQTTPQDCIGEIWEKCLDGLNWMNAFDSHPLAMNGLDRVRERVREHNAAGRAWLPWANVRGWDAATEGGMAAEIAIVAHEAQTAERKARGFIPTYIANVEPYSGFWPHRGADSAGRARDFVAAYKAGGGQALWLWVDARHWQLTSDQGIGLTAWLSACEAERLVWAILPETYWTDFSGSLAHPETALRETVSLLEGYGVPRQSILMTLPANAEPANAEPADVVTTIRLAHAEGLGRPNLWQRMNLRPETALVIAGLADPWNQPPPEIPPATAPSVDVVGARADLRAALAKLGG